MKLTVTVITRDEAANIAAALRSVSWADEIVVVDSNSTDETVEIARQYACRVEIRDWQGYSEQKNYAAALASNDWILSLDADERVTPALATEIQTLMRQGPAARGYRISRVTWYLGRWLLGTDWYPDYQLRLYDRRAGKWNGRRVHESFELDEGVPARLQHRLEHYAYRNVSDHISSIDHYTTLAAEQWAAEGRRTNLLELAVHPPVAFLRNYLFRLGIANGVAGFLVSTLNSYYVFLKLVKLWELQHSWRRPEETSSLTGVGAGTSARGPRSPATGQRSTASAPRSPASGPRP